MTGSRGQPPIDRGWAWMISLGFFVYVFFMVGLAKSYGLILVALIREFHVTTATAALPISICLLVYAFGAPTAILVAERFTIQKVVFVGAIIGFIGISLSSLLVNMTYFIAMFGLFYGIGNSCFYGNGMIMIGKYFRRKRSLANGLALSGASIGQFALPPLIEFLLENYKLSGTLLLIGAFYLHGAISGALFRPIEQYDSPTVDAVTAAPEEEKNLIYKGNANEDGMTKEVNEEMKNGDTNVLLPSSPVEEDGDNHHSYSDKNHQLSNADAEKGTIKDSTGCDSLKEEFPEDVDDLTLRYIMGSQGDVFMVSKSVYDLSNEANVKKGQNSWINKIVDFSILRNYVTLFFTIVSFLCFFGYFNFILFLPSIVLEKGIEKYDKAFLISICGIGDLIARISIGFFGDLNIMARYKIKALACLLCAFNIFMFVFADSFIWLAVHCFLYGFVGGGYVCMIVVVLVDFVGLANMGRNLAVVLFIQGIGTSAGNPLLGFLKDETGSFVIVSVLCALSLCMGSILLFFYPVVRRLEDKRVQRQQEA